MFMELVSVLDRVMHDMLLLSDNSGFGVMQKMESEVQEQEKAKGKKGKLRQQNKGINNYLR